LPMTPTVVDTICIRTRLDGILQHPMAMISCIIWMLLPLALLAAMSLYATSPNFAVWKTSRKTRRHRPIPATGPVEHVAANDCTDYKLLYYKLHNLELHPDILPGAKSLLLSFLSEALQCERHITKSTIWS